MIKILSLNTFKIPCRKLENFTQQQRKDTQRHNTIKKVQKLCYLINFYKVNPVFLGPILDTGFTNLTSYAVFLLWALEEDSLC